MADEYFTLVGDDAPHDVVLTDPGARVLDVAQVIRRLTGPSRWRSKVLASHAPAVILDGVPEKTLGRRSRLSARWRRRQR